jgi:hypothetical protein
MRIRMTKELIKRFNEIEHHLPDRPFIWDIQCKIVSCGLSDNNGFVGTLMLGYSDKTMFLYNGEEDQYCAIIDGDVIDCNRDLKRLVRSPMWRLIGK